MKDAMKKIDVLNGRQIVFLRLVNFKTFDNSEVVYGFDHLVSCESGTDLHAFTNNWTTILDNMNGELSTEALRDVVYRTIKGVEQLKLDMNIYERFRENDVNKAFE
jgi:hypothetical protein